MKSLTILLAACVTWLQPAAHATETEIELRQSFAGHIVLPTMIGEHGPFPFILDTGANQTAILDVLVRQIGLSMSDGVPDTFYGLTGPSATVILGLSQLDFGAGPAPVDQAVTVDANLDANLVAFGLLGTDAFRGRQVEIDLTEHVLRLDTGENWPASEQDGWIDNMGLLRISGTANGTPVTFIVDTGATRSFINRPLAEAVMTNRQRENIDVFGMGPQQGRAGEVRVGTIRFAGVCERNFRALATDFPIFDTLGVGDTPAMIVGLDLLDDSVIQIDFLEGRFSIRDSAACRRRSSSLFRHE